MGNPMGIYGIGAATGYGWGTERLWDGLMSSKPAAALVAGFGATPDEHVWLARVPEGGEATDGATRSARAMRGVAREAIVDATARGWSPGKRVGLLHALVVPEAEAWRDFYVDDGGRRNVRGYLALMPSTPVSMFMQEFGVHGPAMNVSAMCASANAGLITAKMWLDSNVVDDVVFVATDLSLTPENVDHFVRLGSSGFPAGEASISFVLSVRGDSAASAYASVLGGAMTHDAFHVTSVDPSRVQIDACVDEALRMSGVGATDIGYLNAHGPGTQQCDTAEAGLVDEVFGGRPQMYSMKPLAGHCQGAAAAVEIAAAALGYEHGVVPAPPTVAPGHRRLLDGPTPMRRELTLKTSLGMGGQNSAVVLAPPGC